MTEVEKHTSGPWTSHDKGIHPNPYICGREIEWEHGIDAPVIAYIVGVNTEANARLIAAAPELLEALKNAKDIIRIWHGPNAWEVYERSSPEMRNINDAIAKATGEP